MLHRGMRAVKTRLAGAALAGLIAGAGCVHRPAIVLRGRAGAELNFLARYGLPLSASCPQHDLELVLADRPNVVIDTQPPISESSWRLRACGYDLRFTLDCASSPGAGARCQAHEWPTPADYGADSSLARELEAAASLAPRCAPARSCRHSGQCGDDGLALRAVKLEAGAAGWEVSRCGETKVVPAR